MSVGRVGGGQRRAPVITDAYDSIFTWNNDCHVNCVVVAFDFPHQLESTSRRRTSSGHHRRLSRSLGVGLDLACHVRCRRMFNSFATKCNHNKRRLNRLTICLSPVAPPAECVDGSSQRTDTDIVRRNNNALIITQSPNYVRH